MTTAEQIRKVCNYASGDYDKPVTAPLYRPVSSVLSDFNKGNNKAQCRKELQDRLLYMTAIDKKRVIYTFLDGCR